MPFDLNSLLLLLLMGVGFYFLLIRPQQKRAKEQQELTSSLAVDARVMTSSGVLATVKHVGEKQLILEISPGVEMTVIKQAVLRVLKADDDEFEYADVEAAADDQAPAADAVADAQLAAEPVGADPLPDESPAAGQDSAKN